MFFAFDQFGNECRYGGDAPERPRGFMIGEPVGAADHPVGQDWHEIGIGAGDEGVQYADARTGPHGLDLSSALDTSKAGFQSRLISGA